MPLAPTAALHVVQMPTVGLIAGLSGRGREVLRLVANGWTNERIAGELFLSPRTI